MLINQGTAGLDKCGQIVQLPEYSGMAVTAYTASARADGQPIYLVYGYTAGQEVVATTAATATYVQIAFAVGAVAAGKIGLFLVSGKNFPGLVSDVGTMAVGRCLEVINAGTSLIDMGSSTVAPITTHAILEEAVTADENDGSPVLKNIMVPPNFPYKTIAGS